jgi:hypothetical protein
LRWQKPIGFGENGRFRAQKKPFVFDRNGGFEPRKIVRFMSENEIFRAQKTLGFARKRPAWISELEVFLEPLARAKRSPNLNLTQNFF